MKTRSQVPQFFGLDLNCAIYHCVKKVQTKRPYTEEAKQKWEAELIESVIEYIKQMNAIVNPSTMLYIAVDGVAPMAKIKQQRMRRFKSAIQAEQEARIRAEAKGAPYVPIPRWDTNAITPGTKFMEKLSHALRAYQKTKPKNIVVSPADEPGEGEQKIVHYLRKSSYKDAVIYGLDADLIVLAMNTFAKHGINVDLFREEVEMMGGVKTDSSGKESFLYLNIDTLSKALYDCYGTSSNKSSKNVNEFLQDFVALMSLLGNDFVPHGMSLKIRDEGIEKLLHIYTTLNTPLRQNGTYTIEALQAIFQAIQEKEPIWMLKGIRQKLGARTGFTHSRNPEDIALAKFNDTPVEWAAEACMVDKKQIEGVENPQMILKPTWKEIYDTEALWNADKEKVAKSYIDSLLWTFAYYSGEQVDMYWYYPWLLPPRAESILDYLNTKPQFAIPNTPRTPITPTEQLAMVLPLSSFSLLPPEFINLEKNHPYAWPTSWANFSFGRRFLWECEPLIPLIQPNQIKQWIEILYES